MRQDPNQMEMPARQLMAGAAPSVWTEIGEAEVRLNLFGRARVRIVRRHGILHRSRWTGTMLLVLLLVLGAVLAWRGGFLQKFPLSRDALSPVQETTAPVAQDNAATAPAPTRPSSDESRNSVADSSNAQEAARAPQDSSIVAPEPEQPALRHPAKRRDQQAQRTYRPQPESTAAAEPPAFDSAAPVRVPAADSVSEPVPEPQPAAQPVEMPKMAAPLQQAPAVPPVPAMGQ